MGEPSLHGFKAESGTGELMRGSFCEGESFSARESMTEAVKLMRWGAKRRIKVYSIRGRVGMRNRIFQTKGSMQSFSVSKVSVADALVSDTYKLSLDSMLSRSKTSACSHSRPFTRSGVAMLRVGSLRPRRRRVSRWR